MLYRIQKTTLLTHLYSPLVKSELFALIERGERILNRLMPLIALAMWAFGR